MLREENFHLKQRLFEPYMQAPFSEGPHYHLKHNKAKVAEESQKKSKSQTNLCVLAPQLCSQPVNSHLSVRCKINTKDGSKVFSICNISHWKQNASVEQSETFELKTILCGHFVEKQFSDKEKMYTCDAGERCKLTVKRTKKQPKIGPAIVVFPRDKHDDDDSHHLYFCSLRCLFIRMSCMGVREWQDFCKGNVSGRRGQKQKTMQSIEDMFDMPEEIHDSPERQEQEDE